MPLLQLTSLAKAVERLDEGLERYRRDTSDGQIRDGLIQRFEFTYELCHRMLRRYLELTAASRETIETMAFQDLIRTGNELALLEGDWPRWRVYREMRSITSHSYDEAKALQVVAIIPGFLREARFLLARLLERPT